MPEGDTVLRTARRLHEALAGRVLERVDLRWGELDGTARGGDTTLDVVARGKHILHRLDSGWTLHSHLRMEGSWHVQDTTRAHRDSRRRDVRAVLAADPWTAIGFRLGMLDLIPTGEEHRLVGHLGPDILGPDWDEGEALRRVLSAPSTIGQALLDQRNLAGIGTLYCSESLFLERLNPWSPVTELPEASVRSVIRRAYRLLHANVEHAVQSTTGSRRRGETAYVHARSGQPCRRCGTTVRVAMIGPPTQERTMFSCPRCQPGERPTDTDAFQAPLGARRNSSRAQGNYRR